MRRLLFSVVLITAMVLTGLWTPTRVGAQSHPCDLVQPTSGTGVAGQVLSLHACHPGVDTNGNPITGWAIYDNGVRQVLALTKGTTQALNGQFDYSGPYTVPATAGLHQIEYVVLWGALESPRGGPFALTVSLPLSGLPAPTRGRVQ